MNNGLKRSGARTPGVGYISIILIFTVICLTMFAVLSFQAAYSDSKLTRRSESFTQQYYSADASAKKILAQLDGAAAQARQGFSFAEEFSELTSEINGITVRQTLEGVEADYTVEISDSQSLSVSVVFYRMSADKGYEILSWQMVTQQPNTESHQNVWDGEDIV